VKLHLLPYLVDNICCFGPAILFETELFESYNSVFRLCSIFSNHCAPSRNIALSLGGIEHFKHIVSGRWWKTPDTNYAQAGPGACQFFNNEEFCHKLGWKFDSEQLPGVH
jgi:hypothetical protein